MFPRTDLTGSAVALPVSVPSSRTNVMAKSAADKAQTLIDSLPWLKTFHDAIIVVKYGGNAMVSPELQQAFADLRRGVFAT